MASNDQQDGIKNYEVYDAIGHGGFGKVYRALCLRSNQEVAIKFIEKRKIKDQPMIKRVKSEVEIHSRLKHPYVLEVLNFFEDDVYVYLVLEYCENSDLNSYLKKHSKLTEPEACHFMQQIVNGILYLHKHNILHRDLKLSNILLTKDMTIKVADFGVATRLENSEEKHFTMCGTPNFIAPEVVMKGPYGLEADVWSVGCMLYSLLVGEPPFSAPDVKNTLNRIISTGYDLPEDLSTEAKDLIGLLLQKDGKIRIALEKILEHSFFTKRSFGSSFCIAADETSSADSGRDTLGTTSGELVTCSHPSSSVASSFDSNSKIQPTPPVTEQQLYDGDGNRAQPSTPALSFPSQRPTELCQVQPQMSPHLPQLHTPVKQLFSATKNLQRKESEQKVQYNDGVYLNGSIPMRDIDQCYGAPNPSSDRDDPDAMCQNQMSSGVRSSHVQSVHGKSAMLSGHRVVPRQATPNPNVAFSGPVQSAPRQRILSNDAFHQNFRMYDPNLYQNHQAAKSHFSREPQFPEQDFDDRDRRSPALSEGSLPEDLFDENIRQSGPAFSNNTPNSDEMWEQQQMESNGNFYRSIPQHHQSDNDLYHSDGFYGGNPKHSTHRLSIHSPITVKTLQRTRHRQQTPLSNVRSRSVENVSRMDDHGQSGRWSAVSIDVDGEQLPQKMFRVPPLCAVRLRLYTEKKRGAVAHILEDGDVYLEFFKSFGNEERVFEAFCISPDGQMIKTYHMNVPLDASLKPHPHSVPSQTFTYAMLPKKYWKKYEYAARFVNALRSVTVKLTLYSDRAKAILMENSPNQDFEVNFYDGGRFKVKSSGTAITQADGTSMILESSSSFTHLSHETQDMWQHVQELHVLCKEFDAFFTEKLSHRMSCFPIVIGRKPQFLPMTKRLENGKINEMNAFISGHQPSTGFSLTNRNPSSGHSVPWTQHPKLSSGNFHEMPSQMSSSERQQEALIRNHGVQLKQMKMFKLSNCESKVPPVCANHSAARVVKQIHEPSIGTAHEYSNGFIVVAFNNGSRVQLDRTTSRVMLKDPSGQCTVFTQNDTLPGKIVSELYMMLGKLGLYAVE